VGETEGAEAGVGMGVEGVAVPDAVVMEGANVGIIP